MIYYSSSAVSGSERMGRRLGVWSGVCVPLLFSALVVGCAKSGKESAAEGQEEIKRVAQLYMSSLKGDKGPKDVEELKKFARSLKGDQLKSMGIEDLDKAMISPRDGEPYVLVPPSTKSAIPPGAKMPPTGGRAPPGGGGGRPPSGPGMGRPSVVVHEKEGKGGKRYIAYSMGGSTALVDDEEFKRLMSEQ